MRNFSGISGGLRQLALWAGVCAAGALAGCGASPMLHVGNAVANMGQDLPADMRERHLAAMIAFDEDFAGRYNRVSRNVLYVNGIVEGTPEYLYRVARVNLHHSQGNWVWKEGSYLFQTGALIPDHLPALKSGDVIEVRQTGTWRTMENFSQTGEGNIVVRVLCAKADPRYEACLEKAPRIGTYRGQGPTGTPYPRSVKDYGFKFTPKYDADGRLRAR